MIIKTLTPIFCLLSAALPVSAKGARAFVWNDRATGSGVPNGFYQFNSAGGSNFVTNLGTGKYRVDLQALGMSGGTVHVTAYGGNHYCKTQSWYPSGTTMQVFVNCFEASGLPANGLFTLLFYAESSADSSSDKAYLWVDNPTAPNSTPYPAYQWNSKSLTNTLTHIGTGLYRATLPGLTSSGGTVLVTAYGNGSERCKVAYWNPASSGLNVSVSCFRADGSPADTQFTLSFMNDVLVGGAFTWADQPFAQSYTPSPTYQHSYGSNGSPITINRNAAGAYTVNLPSQPPYDKTAALVTAYGTTSDYCNVAGWFFGANQYDTSVSVNCYNAHGSPVDTTYTMQYLTNRLPYISATTAIECGNTILTVSTGNGDGKCGKTVAKGKDVSAACYDNNGNFANASCVLRCEDVTGSGSCTIKGK